LNVLIGGRGADRLTRGDLLIASATIYDGDPVRLAGLVAEWTTEPDYAARVTQVTLGGGLNAPTVDNPTGPGRQWPGGDPPDI
jgi:hypothetical protein